MRLPQGIQAHTGPARSGGGNRQAGLRQHDIWATVLFFLFVFATFTGLNPLAERRGFSSALDTGSADIFRQICYLALLVGAILLSSGKVLRNVPLPMLILFGWFAVTLLWSPVPDIAGRRLGLTIVIAITAFILSEALPLERMVKNLCIVIAIMMVASLAAAMLVPALAIHQVGDTESTTIGDLRGIFYHKNILGGVAAISVILAIYSIRCKIFVSWQAWGYLFATVLCLYLSRSKTSLGISAIAVIMYFVWLRFHSLRHLIWVAPAFVVLVGALFSDRLAQFISDPDSLTGRGYIWHLTLEVFMKNPFGGVGYQSIFQTGGASAFAQMVNDRFFATLSHAHNSYLEIAASTGLIGLALLIWALVSGTFQQLAVARLPRELEALLTSISIFVVLHSFSESGLADRDRSTWVLIMLIIGGLNARMRKLRNEGGPVQRAAMRRGRRLAPRYRAPPRPISNRSGVR